VTEQEQRRRHRDRLRIGAIVACLAIGLVPVVVVFAASPEPSSSIDPSASASSEPSASAEASSEATASTEPSASASASASAPAAPLAPQSTAKPDTSKTDGSKGDRGGHGFGGITITGIAGSKLSLETEDGWTRTIVVTADTKITKGGKPATVSDLALGDKITFRQKRNDDGTYTITAINVPTPKAGGRVTAIGSTTLTITAGRGGDTRVITVNGSTVYTSGKDTAATKSDIVVGSQIVAFGTVSGDAFTATSVRILPSVVGGEVTAKTSTSLTLKTRDGTSVTVHIDSSTKVFVRGKGKDATIADIAVGDKVLASGALKADGSIDADMVGGGKFGHQRDDQDKDGASPSPSGPTT
jgi:hypothetical protein